MEKQFVDLLEKVLEYEEKQLGVICALFVFLLIGIGIPFVVNYKKISTSDKIVVYIVVFVIICVFVAFLINAVVYKNNIYSDIFENRYVVYQGEIYHDNYQKDSFYHNVYIFVDSEDRILLRYPDYGNHYDSYTDYTSMPEGVFTGTITYSEKSKIVLNWQSP